MTSLPADAFAELPYPGVRVGCSFVLDAARTVHLLEYDATVPARYRLRQSGEDLDAWLAGQGAPAMAERRPVLSYGSNANPLKIVRHHDVYGVSLPSVNVQVTVTGHAAVWCSSPRGDGEIPATLAPWPGATETHVVTWMVPDDLAGLDRVEGVPTWYQREPLAGLYDEYGDPVSGVIAYIGQPPGLSPVTGPDGAPVRVFRPGVGLARAQAEAKRLVARR